jgi:sugar phosphate isomerase/epimerase
MVGISTCCLMDKPLEEALDELAALTDLIEVMDEGPHFITDPSLFESYTCTFTLHAPFHGMNIASVFEPVRKASVEVMVDCFCVAAAIGAPVVMHPGYFAWEQERAASDRQFRTSLQELGCAAADRSVEFWFENMGDMNYFNLRTPADLPLIGEAGLTLDTGHAHLNHCLPAFLATPFRHMHIHDNKGKTDTHGPVGSGTIDFRPVMAALRRSHATAVIEVKTFVAATSSLQVLDAL